MSKRHAGAVACHFFVTGGAADGSGRFGEDELREILAGGAGGAEACQGRTLGYVCGPGGFIRDSSAALRRCGVAAEDVRCEVWW